MNWSRTISASLIISFVIGATGLVQSFSKVPIREVPIESHGRLHLKSLLIYYAWPSVINGASGDVEMAAAEFSKYRYVVLGDGLYSDTHPEYAKLKQILAHPKSQKTTFFGYIDLGVTTQDLSLNQVKFRMDEWAKIGIAGIFLDDFGYDFHVTRERQNVAVDYAHSLGLVVMANAWRPEDVFDAGVDPVFNARGLPPALGPFDFYLFESFQIKEGQYMDATEWYRKVDKLEQYRRQYSTQVMAVTTTQKSQFFNRKQYLYGWYSAIMLGYEAYGWGEPNFAADSARVSRQRPPDVHILGPLAQDLILRESTISRKTQNGEIVINIKNHDAYFLGKRPKIHHTAP